jgi:cytosine permease
MDRLHRLSQLPEHEIYDTRVVHDRTGDSETAQEDYALRRVPATWRWSAWGSLWAFSGMSTAMAYPLTASLLTMAFGGSAVVCALILAMLYTWVGVWYMSKKAANEGAILELISKHTFGFRGSAYQIVVFGLLGTIYFSLEGHVMATALTESVPRLSYDVSAAIICVAFIPLTMYGMQFLSRFQSLTVWLYVLGVVLALIGLFGGWSNEISSKLASARWWEVNPGNAPFTWVGVLGAFGAFSGLLGSILVLLCTDTARFARRHEAGKVAALTSFIGATVPVIAATLFGIYLLASSGGKVPDPGVSLVRLLGTGGLFLVIVTQLRVNVINVYFGTNALENFASQVFKLNWKRSRFLVPFMIIAYLVVTSPFLAYFGTIMTMLSVFLFNWTMVLFGDLMLVRKRFDLPQWSEFRRGYVAQYNRIGMTSMWVPTAAGVAMGSGLFGFKVQALAVPLSGIVAFLMPLVVSRMMSRNSVIDQYFARIPESVAALSEEHECDVCSHSFHRSDFVLCPFHDGKFICSNCCAAEKACRNMCHTESVIPAHIVRRGTSASAVGTA